jgi:hypothetical protein
VPIERKVKRISAAEQAFPTGIYPQDNDIQIFTPTLSSTSLLDLVFEKSKYCKLSKVAFLTTNKQINGLFLTVCLGWVEI